MNTELKKTGENFRQGTAVVLVGQNCGRLSKNSIRTLWRAKSTT